MTKKKTSKPATDKAEDKGPTLEQRVEALERKHTLTVEGFRWAANEVRPMFGVGAIALVLDGIADGLEK